MAAKRSDRCVVGVHGGGCRATEVAPCGSKGPEEDDGPEEQRQAEFKKNAQHERNRRENGTDSSHEGVPEGKGRAGEVCLEGRAVIFDQSDANVGLRNSGKKAFVQTQSYGGSFIGLGELIYESDGVAGSASCVHAEVFEDGRDLSARRRGAFPRWRV